MVIYAYYRLTDDMIDEQADIAETKRNFELIEKFVKEIFADRESDYEVKTSRPYEPRVDWTQYESALDDAKMACFRSISRMAFYLPRKPFLEMLTGYKWDIENRCIKNENDLLLYCRYLLGGLGVTILHVITYRCHDVESENRSYVVEKAEQMGIV